jgi:ribosomal protein L37AE/L43A
VKAPSSPTLPKCRECKAPNPRVAGNANALEWLCASCEYKRSHPGAAPAAPLPRERRPLPLQSEALF